MKNNNYVLLVKCNDEQGLIYKITQILFSKGLNIVNNREFVSEDTNYFFMRTEILGSLNQKEILTDLKKVLPENAIIKLNKSAKKDIIVMVTKEHHCLSELLIQHHYNEINVNIKAVLSNHQVLETIVKKFDIPFYYVSANNLSREKHEAKILKILKKEKFDYIALAKYMRIFTPNFVSKFKNKIINIHHSFLPAFIGADPYRQAYNRGVKIIGATAHFINEDLDEGPIIVQNVIHINHTYNYETMKKARQTIEKTVFVRSIELISEDRIFVNNNKTIVFD